MITSTEPVFGGYFADPFVYHFEGAYYAVGTGAAEAAGRPPAQGRVFPMLRSTDFAHWEPVGPCLERPHASLGSDFWAPEIALRDGRFYLYYSVGHGDQRHHLRVASSDHPAGPFRDMGVALTDLQTCSFAIDPHPFRDDDGNWYLFYARDFLDTRGCSPAGRHPRFGTALVVRRLVTMTELGPELAVVMRAHHDWQLFEASRAIYDRVIDWHTLEGPSVVKHDGAYFCFYSGGCWKSDGYGVDYAKADNIGGPYSDDGAEQGPRVLRSSPGEGVCGPGHNSTVLGPDGSRYVAYHAWNSEMTLRQMYLAPLTWTPQGPRILPARATTTG